MNALKTLALVLLGLAGLPCFAAESLPRVFRSRIEPHWITNTTEFWYRNDNPDGKREFVLVNAATGVRSPAFDHASVAQKLGSAAGVDSLPIDTLVFSANGRTVTLVGGSKSWELDRETGVLNARPTQNEEISELTPLRRHRNSRSSG